MALLYTEALLAQAQTWVSTPLTEKRSAAGLSRLSALYGAITGTEPGSCRQCQYSDYNAAVTQYVRQAQRILYPDTMPKQTYTFAPGFENETFVHEKYPKAVTADTLDDKDAEFFIENGYRHAFLKDGKPLPVETAKEEDDKPAGKMLKADHQARYEELHGVKPDAALTVDELTKANDAKQAELDAAK